MKLLAQCRARRERAVWIQANFRFLDPLFRSGVALTGASDDPSGIADPAGILTAYEAAALNLSGTQISGRCGQPGVKLPGWR